MMSHRKRKYLTPRTGTVPAEPEASYKRSYSTEIEVSLNEINAGDLVRHVVFDHFNAGLPLQVLDTNYSEALCTYTEGPLQTPVVTWYSKADLIVVDTEKENEE